jgi:type II secretion system protein G
MKQIFKKERGFTLIELMVVVAIIGILSAMLTPQITNFVYKARVSSTAGSLRSFGAALDLMINDLGYKPNVYGAADTTNDQLALMKRTSCPSNLQSVWNGPYIRNYPTSGVSSLIYYPSTIWFYYSWPGSDSGTWGNYCGTGYGVMIEIYFINSQATADVGRAFLGKVDPNGDAWMEWCGFYDDRQVAHW